MLFSFPGENANTKAELLKSLGLEKEWSGLSWPLPNMRPSSEKDFWGWRSSYGFRGEVWCNQHRIDGEWATIILFWMDHSQFIGGGFAVAIFRQYGKERVEYFEWRDCDHVFDEKNTGNCQHRYTCKKCQRYYDVDSSG